MLASQARKSAAESAARAAGEAALPPNEEEVDALLHGAEHAAKAFGALQQLTRKHERRAAVQAAALKCGERFLNLLLKARGTPAAQRIWGICVHQHHPSVGRACSLYCLKRTDMNMWLIAVALW